MKHHHPRLLWHDLPLAAALLVALLSLILTACTQQSQPVSTPATVVATQPVRAAATPTFDLKSLQKITSKPSGGSTNDGEPQSLVHLTIGGSLSGTMTITGFPQSLPTSQGENPVMLAFIVGDGQNGGFDLRLHNYVGPGHYELHGCMGCGNKDDLGVWTGGGDYNLWNMWNTDYDTACTVDINSDTPTQYGILHEVQGFVDCGALYLVTDTMKSIVCAGHFDVFVDVPSISQ